MENNGLLVIFSGPSGAGKGTVMKYLLSHTEEMRLSVSATTRSPRQGETNGNEYYFLTREEFQQMVQQGKMLESAEYCGNFYGTPAEPVDRWISEGKDVILEIEVQGGAQVKQKRPDAVGIFLVPPSLRVLEHRLRNRGTEPEEVVKKRLETARHEISQAKYYDYVVVNDTVEHAAEQICRILAAEKCSIGRNAEWIERMLKND